MNCSLGCAIGSVPIALDHMPQSLPSARFRLDGFTASADNINAMARFRIDSIADLAHQLAFSPLNVRTAQIASAEELVHSIIATKAYPLDFIVFRITGYTPKGATGDLLTGIALQHDLGLLIESVSDTLDIHTESLAEPVLAIDDVTVRFNVTSKTIQRWRRKGLPARKFLFPDGKRRVGFLVSSVERFFATHREQVDRGTNFSQVDDSERDSILRRARRLAVQCRCCVNEISRRIAQRLNRSPATVQHIIRKYDEEHPSEAIFPTAAPELGDSDRESVLKHYRRGIAIGTMAKRLCCPRAQVYRVLLQERINKLNRKKIRFIDDELYHGSHAIEAVKAIVEQKEPGIGGDRSREELRVPRDLPPYLQELYRTPLLTPERERAAFLKFNFHKFQFVQARRRLDPQFARSRDLHILETHLRNSSDAKNAIIRANLRLVVSIARKHLRPGLSLMELISDGNITLMRAVEGFDTHRGHRFSTYATLALMKGFARSVPIMLSSRQAAGDAGLLAAVPDVRSPNVASRFDQREEVGELLSRLDDRERSVLLAHYGLSGQPAAETYEQVGQLLGMTKQRVRQIEQSALAKLRTVVEARV